MKNLFILFPLAITVMIFTTSCEQEGPAEKAGKSIDNAVEEVNEDIEQSRENLEDQLDR